MSQTQNKTEVIRYGDKEFPLEGMTIEQAKEIMARHFPELASPRVEKKLEGDKTIHIFSKQAGTKGLSESARAAQEVLGAVIEFQPIPQIMLDSVQAFEEGQPIDLPGFDENEVMGMASVIENERNAARNAADRLLLVSPNWSDTGGLL